MTSNLKNVYYERYNDADIDNLSINKKNIEDDIDMPTGWSFICLDETINYYTENINRTLSSTD
uniref:Uncharacterized protein n=1 Tax=Polysiphonia sp. TaxID=1967842 RepID=A0A1Z1M3T2_9FLOR|nr:hypothetical protein [Polysiphonia sp.]